MEKTDDWHFHAVLLGLLDGRMHVRFVQGREDLAVIEGALLDAET